MHRAFSPAEPGSNTFPAILLLHGRGSNELDLLELADELDPRLGVISVRAPFTLEPGYQWYEFQEAGSPEANSFTYSLDKLSSFIDEVVEGYGIRSDALYVLGFSQGAMMAGSMALLHPDRISGAVLLSGYISAAVQGKVLVEQVRGKPFFVAHGIFDSVLPIEFGSMARSLLEQVGVDLTYREYPIEHYVDVTELGDLSAWLTTRLDSHLASG